MKPSKTIYVLPLFLALIFAPAIHAETAKESTRSFLNTLLAMEFPIKDAAKHEPLVKKADSYLDLEAMSKKALEAHWSEASPEQQKEFMELIWKLIESIAYPRSHKFLADSPIDYGEEKAAGKGVQIETVVKNKDSALDAPVVYDLYSENGNWKIYDIFLDGVSITEDLKSQFDRIIKDSSFAGLLTKMHERLVKAQKEINEPAAA